MSEDPRSAMEGRARRRASPAGIRTKAVRVEPEPPPPTRRHEPGTRAAVVYYLCRNHHLEHPHFMEVQLTSPQGLYLRDVSGRLDALRGKGMAAKYSWSCKRSYKTGFVWHDLSADDLLLPTQGTEYVLKGSELPFDQAKPTLPLPDHQQNSTTSNAKVQPCNPTRQQESPRSPGSSNQGWTSKSPSPTPTTYHAIPVIKEAVPPPAAAPPPTHAAVVPANKEVAVPPPPPQPALLSSPTASTIGDEEQCRLPPHSGSSSNSSPKTSMASSGTSSPSPTEPTAAGSNAATQTDDKARWDNVKLQRRQDTARASSSPEGPEIVVDEPRSTHPPAGEHPRSRRNGTLQSLIRAEAAGRRRALPLPEEDDRAAAATGGSISGRLKPANLLMRLMACGPTHPGFGLVQNSSYKPRFAQLEYPSSPELSPLGALKPGTTGASTARASETENCSGRLLDGAGALKRSSSSRSHPEGVICEEEAWPKGFNNNLSRSASKRTSDPSSGRTASSKVVSFRDE